jgi:hypothetical protein
MGTRADFYVGRGETAEWLGSIAWDGYPNGIDTDVLKATTEEDYRGAVTVFLGSRNDSTLPERGWPWPWEDSRTTDYAYAFDEKKVYASCFGYGWFDPQDEEADHTPEGQRDTAVFPDMSARKNTRFDKGSGLIILGPSGPE